MTMKLNCNVVTDLLELYSDGIVSQDTRELVDEHLAECVECSRKLAHIQKSVSIPAKTDVKPLKKIKRKIKLRFFAYGAIMLPMVFAILLLSWKNFEMWRLDNQGKLPPAIAFDEIEIKVEIESDEMMSIHYMIPNKPRRIAHMGQHKVLCDDSTYEYHINARYFKPEPDSNGVWEYPPYLDFDFEDGERSLARVYYCESDRWGTPFVCSPDVKHLIWENK